VASHRRERGKIRRRAPVSPRKRETPRFVARRSARASPPTAILSFSRTILRNRAGHRAEVCDRGDDGSSPSPPSFHIDLEPGLATNYDPPPCGHSQQGSMRRLISSCLPALLAPGMPARVTNSPSSRSFRRLRQIVSLGASLGLAAFVLPGASGCSARATQDGADPAKLEPIPSCETYLTAYRKCLNLLGPQLADQRIAALRASLDSPSRDTAQLSAMCSGSLSRLTTSCH
jgi:hypothetical protein